MDNYLNRNPSKSRTLKSYYRSNFLFKLLLQKDLMFFAALLILYSKKYKIFFWYLFLLRISPSSSSIFLVKYFVIREKFLDYFSSVLSHIFCLCLFAGRHFSCNMFTSNGWYTGWIHMKIWDNPPPACLNSRWSPMSYSVPFQGWKCILSYQRNTGSSH